MGMRAPDDKTIEERLAHRAVELAEALLREARAQQTPDERAQARKLARMMADPHGKELTIALADQAFRSRRPERIADQLAYLLDRYGVPRYMDWWERVALLLGGAMAHYLPSLVVPPIVNRLRHETQNVILPGEEEDLRRYLAERRRAGMRLNLNQLGEAILGEEEAARRLDAYLALLARDDVEYISVKVSSVFSQIDLVAFRADGGARGRAAAHALPRGRAPPLPPPRRPGHPEVHQPRHGGVPRPRPHGDGVPRGARRAGVPAAERRASCSRPTCPTPIACSASSPRGRSRAGAAAARRSSCASSRARTSPWSASRRAAHGWPQAPYETKAEVDANYKRMLEYGCRPEHAEAVHLGIASHNLFDIAYGLVLREDHGVEPWVEFEMLEGMANHQARAVQARAGRPPALRAGGRAEDFHSAIAYLVRRLDENTAPENFLRHVFDLEPGSPEWIAERDRFLAAFGLEGALSDAPRRTQDRRRSAGAARRGRSRAALRERARHRLDARANRAWIEDVVARWRERAPEPIPLQIGGEFRAGAPRRRGAIPRARRASPIATRSPARATSIARSTSRARRSRRGPARPSPERRALLDACAAELGRRRGDLIGAMIVDGAKTVAEADAEVSEAIDFARYYARALREAAGELADCRMEPLGVVVVTPPWNFPLSIPAGGVLAALAAGNAVILKPAPEAVLVGWWLAALPVGRRHPARGRSSSCRAPTTRSAAGSSPIPRVGAVILTGSVETARLFLGWRPDLRCSPRRAARTRSSSPRSPTAIRPSAISCARPSATTARSARRRASPSARPRCTTIRTSAASSATPRRASRWAARGSWRAASRR